MSERAKRYAVYMAGLRVWIAVRKENKRRAFLKLTPTEARDVAQRLARLADTLEPQA